MAYFEQALAALAQLPEAATRWNRLSICGSTCAMPCCRSANRHGSSTTYTPPRPWPSGWAIPSGSDGSPPICASTSRPWASMTVPLRRASVTLALATTSGAFDVQVGPDYPGPGVLYWGDFRQGLDVARRAMALLTGERRYARFGMVILPAVVLPWLCGQLSGRTGELRRGERCGRRRSADCRGGRAALQYCRVRSGLLVCSPAAKGTSSRRSPRSNGAWRSARAPTSRVYSP